MIEVLKRPIESDFLSHVAYARALEQYCNGLESQEPVGFAGIEMWIGNKRIKKHMTSKDKVNLAMAWYDSGLEDRAAFQTLMESILEQPPQRTEQEPDRTGMVYYKNDACKAKDAYADDCICWTKAQPVQRTEQEPAGEIIAVPMGLDGDEIQLRTHFYQEIPPVGTKVYTTPPAQPAQHGITKGGES